MNVTKMVALATSIIILTACSNKQNSLSTGGVIGGTLGATTGAMVGGMFGLMVAGPRNKNTGAIVAAGALLGAISMGSSGYNIGKAITK